MSKEDYKKAMFALARISIYTIGKCDADVELLSYILEKELK